MSKKTKVEVICPYCQKKMMIAKWDSINVDLNPEEKERIFNGKFFDFNCEYCNKVIHGFYSCLYHDMTHHLMMYLVGGEQEAKEAISMFNDICCLHGKIYEDYQVRITTDSDVWREKATIFDSGYDDRVIEIIKLLYAVEIEDKYDNIRIERTFFCPSKSGKEFVLEFHCQDNNAFTIDVSDELYETVEEKYMRKIQKGKSETFFVNGDWAWNIIRAN